MVLSTCSTMLHADPVSLLRLQFKVKLFHSCCLGAFRRCLSDTDLIVTCRRRHIIRLNLVVACELLMIYVFFFLFCFRLSASRGMCVNRKMQKEWWNWLSSILVGLTYLWMLQLAIFLHLQKIYRLTDFEQVGCGNSLYSMFTYMNLFYIHGY